MIVRKISSGIAAGLCVAIGGMVFLSCDVRYVGAALLSFHSLTSIWCRQFWIWALLKGIGTPLQYSCRENSMDGGAW